MVFFTSFIHRIQHWFHRKKNQSVTGTKEVVEVPNAILFKAVKEMLYEGKQVTLAVKGYSMLPFLRGGRDSVRLRRHDRYNVGDVVLAEVAPQHYILHRIIAIDGNAVTLSGDGNLGTTEQCLLENIVGCAEAVVDSKGWERQVATARNWRNLPRLVRRIVLAAMRRLFYRKP